MAQGDFTIQEANQALEAVRQLSDSLSTEKWANLIGYIVDICLFIAAAKRAAPNELKKEGNGG